MTEDPGFVLDEASGLYCHARSGFYHDPNAGWYYNTHDGVYYTFEDGKYVPIPAACDSGAGILEIQNTPSEVGDEVSNSDIKEEIPQTSQTTGSCAVSEDSSEYELVPTGPGEKGTDIDGCDGVQLDNGSSGVEDEYPLWYFDTGRSMYWYYDKDSRAYYLYQGEARDSGVEETSASDIPSGPVCFQGEHTSIEDAKGLDYQESRSGNENVEAFQPASGWVEEALIDLYLKGYPQEPSVNDEGPWITSADIFSETAGDHPVQNGSNTLGYDDQMSSATNRYHNTAPELQLQSNDSDNDDGSEELEEGEWVPDEPLRIVDGEEGEVCSFYGLENKAEEEEQQEDRSSELHVISYEYYGNSEDFNDFSQENGDAAELIDSDDLGMEDGEINTEDEQKKEEEQWQAQYGQVVREKTPKYVVPGAVDLWDWGILDKESKAPKLGKLKKQLVGRIVSSVTRLHPSLSGSSGLIRTSAIIAAELDFVKVSSGKVYRLRRPSRKHLAAVDSYDSSNPTKNLGFPAIGLAALDTSDQNNVGAASDESQGRSHTLVSKPFIPNTGHWRFRRLLSAKKGRPLPAVLMASRYLSPEETLINEQRKQRYRDRAAERRNLHGGFGIGPGQKGVSVIEEEKMEADEAVGMVGALEKAAAAPALGRENIGKRMLEGMGWKEGQSLGVEGGLVNPIQAQGNVGRAGLGFRYHVLMDFPTDGLSCRPILHFRIESTKMEGGDLNPLREKFQEFHDSVSGLLSAKNGKRHEFTSPSQVNTSAREWLKLI
ncbi:hypothetical protein R1flu_024954 [Riccia fluitans]|uniref:G-patch domain-containing protein n=1 Tax=Riccia fluitans TaxID=41844 RepID=A0ABD1XWD9_9MARC